jgi:hypothetical protein
MTFTRIEASIARAARELVRNPTSSLPWELTQGLTFLLGRLWGADPRLGYQAVDGLIFVDWGKRKSRRLWFRGLVDFLVDGSCFLRRGQENRRIPYGEDAHLRRELEQVGQWEWEYIVEADRAQVS